MITHSRLHLDSVQPDVRDADAFLASYRDWIADEHSGGFHSLPKSIADCLCVAARETTKCARTCRFVSAEKACTLSAGGLIAMLYEEKAAGSAES